MAQCARPFREELRRHYARIRPRMPNGHTRYLGDVSDFPHIDRQLCRSGLHGETYKGLTECHNGSNSIDRICGVQVLEKEPQGVSISRQSTDLIVWTA